MSPDPSWPAHLVAVGDSLVLGTGDLPWPDGTLRGFADRLAASVASQPAGRDRPGGYANLARTSVRAEEVRRDQIPGAIALRADLVVAVVGSNDVIAARFDPRSVARDVHGTLADLRRGLPAATIAAGTLPDLRRASRLARVVAHRVALVNSVVREAAAALGLVLVDLDRDLVLHGHHLALDRAHPGPAGHHLLAAAFAAELGLAAPVSEAHRPVSPRPGVLALRRTYRTVVVAPRFLARRAARHVLIAAQPPKHPDLLPWDAVAAPAPARR